MDQEEQDAVYYMRRAINGMKSDEAVDTILKHFVRTKNNAEFIATIKKIRLV